MGILSRIIVAMISLLVVGLAACASGSLVTYPNGAQVPYDPANLHATAAHLATRGYGYHGLVGYAGIHHLGKRSLVTYPNGAVVPLDPYNQAATASHLAGRGLLGYYPYHHLGKRSLVSYDNGAVVPYNPYLHHGVIAPAHPHGFHVVGKREAEADPSLLLAGVPALYGYGSYGVIPVVGVPLVGHPNGAVVPAEPADVVKARADHLAAHAALH